MTGMPAVVGDLLPVEGDGRTVTVEQVQALQAAIMALPQVDVPVSHLFADGLYGRRIDIPAGTTLTGCLHASQHIAILLAGEVTIWMAGAMRRVSAPQFFVSEPGTKRAIHAHTDATFATVHACEAKTVEDAEAVLITPEPGLVSQRNTPCHS